MADRPKTPEDVLALCRENDVKAVDLRFMDFPGLHQHFTIPEDKLTLDVFQEGLGFDGSSIRGWQQINESDMLVFPVPESAFIDPFRDITTLVMICNIADPITGQDYTRDPRNVARKAVAYLQSSGIADTVFMGPEAEFFIFDEVMFDAAPNEAFYRVDSEEGQWNRGKPGLGYKLRYKEGYFPVPPADSLMDIRNEMVQTMIDCGIDVECQHHEVATGGQAEIDMKFNELVAMADDLLKYKYIVKNVAKKYGKSVTFMPKPIYSDNGSGMHTHFSFWKEGKPLFASEDGGGYAGMSQLAMYAAGGVLKHAPACLAFTNPTTNSYKRLVPGYEAPVNLAYSQRNRSAALRIPMYSQSPKAKRFEFRCPDPSCNPYLAFAALTMAAIDGIQNKIDPGEPLDRDIYDMPAEELAKVPKTPASLGEALAALQADHEFLLKGDVFTEDVVDTWISWKTENEVEPMLLRPHPYEFCLYYDI